MSVLQLPVASRLIYVRDLLRELITRDLKLRYKRSVLGLLWALVTPLSQLMIFTFLFNRVLPLNIPNYTVFVFCGVLAWNWFNATLYMAAGSIVDNRDLVRRPGFPVAVLPVVTVGTNLIHYLLALPILIVFLLFDGGRITPAFAALPVLIAVQFAFTLGLSYLIAAAHVTFRDTQHMLSIILMLLFYLTPVFYSADKIPEQYQLLYKLNPMAHLLTAYRDVIAGGQLPAFGPLLGVTTVSAIMLLVGFSVFQRASDKFVEEL